MSQNDTGLDQATTENIAELRKLLHETYHVALRLKRDIPSEKFSTAYELSRTIRELRKTVEELRAHYHGHSLELEIDLSLLSGHELLSSSESSASIC
jgi:hypothetical protein